MEWQFIYTIIIQQSDINQDRSHQSQNLVPMYYYGNEVANQYMAANKDNEPDNRLKISIIKAQFVLEGK